MCLHVSIDPNFHVLHGMIPGSIDGLYIEPPPIHIIKLKVDNDCTTHIIKVNIQRNYSGWPSLNVFILTLYVSDSDDD